MLFHEGFVGNDKICEFPIERSFSRFPGKVLRVANGKEPRGVLGKGLMA